MPATRYEGARAFPAAADRCFASLPPRLAEELLRLRHSLATRFGPTGQLHDILAAPDDEPWLALHGFVLDDCAVAGPGRERFERGIWLAMLCLFLATARREQAAAGDLDAWLLQEAERQFAALLPAASPFWTYQRAGWPAAGDAAEPAERRLAPLRLGGLAAAAAAGRTDLLPALESALAPLIRAFAVWRELESLHADAASGRMTPVLTRLLRAAGAAGPAARPAAPSREWLVGALVFTGAGAAMAGECQAHLDGAAAEAEALGLPGLARHCRQVRAAFGGLRSRFSLKPAADAAAQGAAGAADGGRRFAAIPPRRTAQGAAALAEGFLLADPTFRESWEVQRGLPGRPAAIGRPFPAGSIVEILCRHGHRLPAQVAEIFDLLAANGFCYFDQPGILPPDADDLGLLLRLFRYSDRPEAHRALLAAPLGLFEAAMRPSGAVPVWLPDPAADPQAAPFALWGDDCATVQAQLVRGLLDYDPAGYRERIERAGRYVCERVGESGLGANRYYAPLYALWALGDLARRLAPIAPEPAAAALAELGGWLERAAPQAAAPQDAALLILAALAIGCRDLPLAAWADLLVGEQRYDGSWRDEPLFVTGAPDGQAGWYSSRSLTTALGYHALKSLQEDG